MLGQSNATAMIAVSDMARAKAFYTDTLGLRTTDEMGDEAATMASGDSRVTIYRSEFAGTNKATAVTFDVADIAAEVDELAGKGVTFEHYDMGDGLKREGDVYVGDGMKTAWFKDPDGNILSLFEGA